MQSEKKISKQEEENAQVVSAYLVGRLKKALFKSNPKVLFLYEFEPIFEVTIDHTPGKSVDAFKSFARELNVVLNGKFLMPKDIEDLAPGAVYKNSTIKFSIMGNPAHVLDDIKRRDPDRLPAPKNHESL